MAKNKHIFEYQVWHFALLTALLLTLVVYTAQNPSTLDGSY